MRQHRHRPRMFAVAGTRLGFLLLLVASPSARLQAQRLAPSGVRRDLVALLPAPDAVKSDILAPTRSRAANGVRGAILGAGIGAIVGAGTSLVLTNQPGVTNHEEDGLVILVFTGAGVIGGVVIGALVGALTRP